MCVRVRVRERERVWRECACESVRVRECVRVRERECESERVCVSVKTTLHVPCVLLHKCTDHYCKESSKWLEWLIVG